MTDLHLATESTIFKELPKEQRKALQKEYFKTAEAKKMNRTFIIVAIIFAVVVIAGAVIGVLTGYDGFFGTFPALFICIWPAMISQQKFEKWLEVEKNIVMKREK
ncbi:MAG: hypothetical protein FWG14_06755 [Peptococcaceae bacterium]|nr:hypothetical protein [Peptococcaceae bacterium]